MVCFCRTLVPWLTHCIEELPGCSVVYHCTYSYSHGVSILLLIFCVVYNGTLANCLTTFYLCECARRNASIHYIYKNRPEMENILTTVTHKSQLLKEPCTCTCKTVLEVVQYTLSCHGKEGGGESGRERSSTVCYCVHLANQVT